MMARLRASGAVLLRHCRSRTKPSSESRRPLAHRAAAPSFSRSRATPTVPSRHQSGPPLTRAGEPPPAAVACTGVRTRRGDIIHLAPPGAGVIIACDGPGWFSTDAWEVRVFRWLRRRRLGDAAQRKLTIAMAHAEEELIETHVENVLDIHESLTDHLPIGELLDLYLEEYEPSDQRAAIVARRVMAQLASAPRVRPRPHRRS